VKYAECGGVHGACTSVGKTPPAAPSLPFFVKWENQKKTDGATIIFAATTVNEIRCNTVAHGWTCDDTESPILKFSTTVRYDDCGGGTITAPAFPSETQFRILWTTHWDCNAEPPAWNDPTITGFSCSVGGGLDSDWLISGFDATKSTFATCDSVDAPDVPVVVLECCNATDAFCNIGNGHTAYLCAHEIACMNDEGGGSYVYHCGDHDVCITVTAIVDCSTPISICGICAGETIYEVTVINPC
jgi:hypothetical protein